MSPFSLHSSAATAAHKTSQQGFTLIELMIALVIFAMLALAGWQIMDSLTTVSYTHLTLPTNREV